MIYIDPALCKSCRLCLGVCPKNVFEISHQLNQKGYNYAQAARPEACIGCRLCERTCPDFAIHVEP